ncbi:MAG: 2-amino-4-hydroxy-6-hydroxymethyldihydropteridine diphosphokinase [Clostridia bacterium]|nr:2-amino-4-hydroxy-6-hydroxymethyldihydropteridine diphosphokinase [Clostridia bacterium]
MNRISVKGLEVYACHGVMDFEKNEEQPFVVSAEMDYDFYEAAKSDDVRKTVSYAEVSDILEKTVSEECYNLIETLCYECAYRILEAFDGIRGLSVTVSKPHAPVSAKLEDVSVTVGMRRSEVYLSLGSSEGDRKAYLDFAVEELKKIRGVKVLAVSSYTETEPYGGVAENMFLNAAAKIECFLSPHQLLSEIHMIEAAAGRKRDVHWGDRTLDIDIVFFGGMHMHEPGLELPHPDFRNREFVKGPLLEIAPELEKIFKMPPPPPFGRPPFEK